MPTPDPLGFPVRPDAPALSRQAVVDLLNSDSPEGRELALNLKFQFAKEEHQRWINELEEELHAIELRQGGWEQELPLKAQPDGSLSDDGASVGIAKAIAPALRTLLEDRTAIHRKRHDNFLYLLDPKELNGSFKHIKFCQNCGRAFLPERPKAAKYCKDTCKDAARRNRLNLKRDNAYFAEKQQQYRDRQKKKKVKDGSKRRSASFSLSRSKRRKG